LVLVLLVSWPLDAAPVRAYSILYNFAGYPNDGQNPFGSLILDGAGNLYGTTRYGGGAGRGTVFTLKTDGTGYTVLHTFTDYPGDGAFPLGGLLLDAHGNLYGTTTIGGGALRGTLFTLKTDGTGYTILHTFDRVDDNGVEPRGTLILDAAGNLYGITTHGGWGDCNCGTIYTLQTDGTGYASLHSFTGIGDDGAYPVDSLILDGAGNLYGTTLNGGGLGDCSPPGCGTVFTLKTDGTSFMSLHVFSGGVADGREPYGTLILDGSGNLYGTTTAGGPVNSTVGCFNGCGTVFTLKTDGTGYTIFYFFSGGASNGFGPEGSLTLDVAGNLYGTTTGGGPGDPEGCLYGCGTIYTMQTDGTGFTTLHFFNSLTGDGAEPNALLLDGSTGNFYGTTYGGGSLANGTVYHLP
jgi:uncharacterized repeat protein (TIGR03803 family)